MPTVQLIMPKLGESIIEATILSWNKQVGDMVEMDEAVLEIATDKVDSEVPSEVAGKITKLLFNEGDVVPVGTAVAIIETESIDNTSETPIVSEPVETAAQAVEETVQVAQAQINSEPLGASAGSRFYSPLVMSMAKEEDISMQELERIPGSGKDGRVTKQDMQSFIQKNSMEARIFALVHDSILAEVPEDEVEFYSENLQRLIQQDRGIYIPGAPIGCDFEIGEDYSMGKFEKLYGDIL